ncbi:MAG: hypothetical protein ACRYFK_03345 [Janthinobacterium lividum]
MVFWLVTHPFVLPILAALSFPAMGVLVPKTAPRWVRGLPFSFMLGAMLNVFFGSLGASSLVYRAGASGRGEVISSYATSTQANHHDVVGYRVLLRTQAGQTVQTSFEDDDFNVYPPANSARYPGVGTAFTARYLPDYPQDFVIVTNDNSPYAHQLGCDRLLDSLHAARRTHEFDRGNAANKQAYRALIHRVLAQGCYTDSLDRREYYGDLAAVQLEPCRALLDSLDRVRTRYNANVADEPNKRVYLALIRRVVARPPCYTDSADLRKYYGDMRRVQASY